MECSKANHVSGWNVPRSKWSGRSSAGSKSGPTDCLTAAAVIRQLRQSPTGAATVSKGAGSYGPLPDHLEIVAVNRENSGGLLRLPRASRPWAASGRAPLCPAVLRRRRGQHRAPTCDRRSGTGASAVCAPQVPFRNELHETGCRSPWPLGPRYAQRRRDGFLPVSHRAPVP